jgi:response regulator RpfG family c-di-GMP phosphodiesterase
MTSPVLITRLDIFDSPDDSCFDLEAIMKTVLVLEDDPSNMQALCALLCSVGYSVLEATTGEEAIAFGKRHSGPIDLFITDVAVPKPSGTEVAVELVKLLLPCRSCSFRALRCMHGTGAIYETSNNCRVITSSF